MGNKKMRMLRRKIKTVANKRFQRKKNKSLLESNASSTVVLGENFVENVPMPEINADDVSKYKEDKASSNINNTSAEGMLQSTSAETNIDVHTTLSTEDKASSNINNTSAEGMLQSSSAETNIDVHTTLSKEKQNANEFQVEGRRLINFQAFYSTLQEIASHGPLNCGLQSIKVIGEKIQGLHSKYTLKCQMCNMKFIVDSNNGSEVDVNNSAVAGVISIGCGYSQLQELSAALDLPVISSCTYQKRHATISTVWEKISLQSMLDAGKKEKDLALEEGRVDKNGIPIIDVIVDGCWSKRTYKKNYSALSGAAAIIGKKTGEVLFLGVKNKYCCICAQAKNKNIDPREHKCYLNYSGASTGMESAVILEGFKCSIKMHGLIYGRLVGDGDSSTYSHILKSRPYPDVTVEKIECRNHLLRNMCNKLANLKTDTRYPIHHRKNITDKKIMSIRCTIRKSIREYKTGVESERSGQVELLYNDILLTHLHAFGDHSRCKTYFCTKQGVEKNSDDFYTSPLWHRICQIIAHTASHATSLVHDVDSNSVERFNSIIAKLIGGKRINFSLKGSYQNRCNAAVVSFNTQKMLTKTFKHIIGSSPSSKIAKLEQKRTKYTKLRHKYNRKKNRKLCFSGQDKDYGENCQKEDMHPDMYKKEKSTFLQNLVKTKEQREEIEKATILQSKCSEWLEVRRRLLTASNFGRVVKRKITTKCGNLVKSLIYTESISHVKSIQHGISNEKTALDQLQKEQGIKIMPCGLFIDEEIPFLGSTPDGISEDRKTIFEIKCPSSAYGLTFDEAVEKKKIPFYKKNKGEYQINKNHNWYFQIQGQLRITKAQICIFGIWLHETQPTKTEHISKDDEFWKNIMEKKLVDFYTTCLLPELIDPRHTRNLPIREPETSISQTATKRKNENIESINTAESKRAK